MTSGCQPTPAAATDEVPAEPNPSSVYVHVPFCSYKCPYCAFACTDDYGGDDVENFHHGIRRELERRIPVRPEAPLRTLYYGGGTPSALADHGLRRLTSSLADRLDLSRLVEFTVEANPSHVSDSLAEALLDLRVNRVSLGAQTFQPRHLRRLGRDHEIADVPLALERLRRRGLDSITLDLMYGLPDQTLAEFAEDLRIALDFGVVHLSLYALEYEPSTPFGRAKAEGRFIPAPDTLAAEMFDRARELCAAYGLAWYEISNFAVPGFESVHNRAYWENRPYVGLGPGAYGRIGAVRYRNATETAPWIAALRSARDPAIEIDRLSAADDAVENLVAGLRTRRGAAWPEPAGTPGREARAAVAERLVAEGYALIASDRLRLTVRGLLVLDSLLPRFLDAGETS
jgi:oxygen-independent coproporphyrinogen-3 oxidase